ncbi:13072_t:CDS:2 [Funneliformis caledonium]|uniref:13072_t:CDS:1 n=1 Tax=Funneliformis caledonium TaxID=1117310 RepID=A0A9N9FRK8_9GLOM|nr:13072_t:CDS:2 [Funneliformis caledonium]
MSKNYSVYIVLFWIVIRLITKVNCQAATFEATKRFAHTATLIDDKLYILGGRDEKDAPDKVGKEFFYLDVSVPFNTQKILWHDLTSINNVPSHLASSSVNGGANNKTLFLCGGIPKFGVAMSLVYAFDTQSNSWSIPTITGDYAVRKDNIMAVVDGNGKMYMFSGHRKKVFFDDFPILDTINLNWAIGSVINAPTPRSIYGVTFLPNNFVIIIGGYDINKSRPLNEVYLYDTINDVWSTKASTIPSDRCAFSAVLGLDGQRVIIFGAHKDNNPKPEELLYVLNLSNFEWYIPKITGKLPFTRYWHQANVIGKYMVVSFGFGYYENDDNDILLLDISNNDEYIWTNDFVITKPTATTLAPNELTENSPSIPKSSPTKPSVNSAQTQGTTLLSIPLSAIIGIIIGTLVSGILLSFVGVLLYKRIKNKKKISKAIPTPGNRQVDDSEHEIIENPTSNINDLVQEMISKPPAIDNHEQPPVLVNTTNGQQLLPFPENENIMATSSIINRRSSLQNLDDVLENFKNDMLHVVRQEIKQNLSQNNK